MKLSEMKFERPDEKYYKKHYQALANKMQSAESYVEMREAFLALSELEKAFRSMSALSRINYTRDTTNETYQEDQKYMNKLTPKIQSFVDEVEKILMKSKWRPELEQEFGSHYFNTLEVTMKTYKPSINDLLEKEGDLKSEYVKLLASAKIEFDGSTHNLTGLTPYLSSPEKEVRIKASEAKYRFFEENAGTFDQLFDDLVKTRHQIAKELGFENFIRPAYYMLRRTDYGPEETAAFRSQIRKHVVPVANKIHSRHAKRIGLDKLNHYDEGLSFKSGNAKPKGGTQWIINQAKDMYAHLSPETDDFFQFMLENELMDVENRIGKASGGYCSYIPKHKSPFIFANFNGTVNDVKVLTHEVGHAFQKYLSRDMEVFMYEFPTLEAAEIHSMSMELFTFDYMDKFFEEDSDKYCFQQASSRIAFLPYAAAVDEFQHYIYQNPEASPDERKAHWRELERVYLPHRNYDGNSFLEKGGFWQQQRHIYLSPFYYIDYALAEICALQFWKNYREDQYSTWETYLKLCLAGGSKPFTSLLELSKLDSPFADDTVKNTVKSAHDWLSGFQDLKM